VQPAEQPLRLVGLVGAVDKADSALKLRGPENAVTVQGSALPTEVGGGDSVTLTDIGVAARVDPATGTTNRIHAARRTPSASDRAPARPVARSLTRPTEVPPHADSAR
jgi:hypothetical protein